MVLSFLVARIRRWVQFRQAVRELARLTDRELDHLGITRIEIRSIARRRSRAAAASGRLVLDDRLSTRA